VYGKTPSQVRDEFSVVGANLPTPSPVAEKTDAAADGQASCDLVTCTCRAR
jgi:hypothetical protein